MSSAPALNRSTIEEIVRQLVLKQSGSSTAAKVKSELVVSISARHIHLTDAHVETLFGPGATLTPVKPV